MAGEDAVGEPLVMAEIEIGLGAVVQHVNFAVLIRVHRAGIDVEIGIELLEDDLQAASSSSVPREAAARPLPSELTTPPVTKIYFIVRVSERGRRVDGKQLALDRSASSGVSTPGEPLLGDDHLNSYSILQRAQLLERFRPFQRRRFPPDEAQEQFARVSVNALVPKIRDARASASRAKGSRSREK